MDQQPKVRGLDGASSCVESGITLGVYRTLDKPQLPSDKGGRIKSRLFGFLARDPQ